MEFYSDIISQKDVERVMNLNYEDLKKILMDLTDDEIDDLSFDIKDKKLQKTLIEFAENKSDDLSDFLVSHEEILVLLRDLALERLVSEKVISHRVHPCNNEDTLFGTKTSLMGDKQIYPYTTDGNFYYCFDTDDISYIKEKHKNPYTQQEIKEEDVELMVKWKDKLPPELGNRSIMQLIKDVKNNDELSDIDKAKVWISDVISKYNPYPDVIGFLDLPGKWWVFMIDAYLPDANIGMNDIELIFKLYDFLHSEKDNPDFSVIALIISKIMEESNLMAKSEEDDIITAYLEMYITRKKMKEIIYSKLLTNKDDYYFHDPDRIYEIKGMDENKFLVFVLNFFSTYERVEPNIRVLAEIIERSGKMKSKVIEGLLGLNMEEIWSLLDLIDTPGNDEEIISIIKFLRPHDVDQYLDVESIIRNKHYKLIKFLIDTIPTKYSIINEEGDFYHLPTLWSYIIKYRDPAAARILWESKAIRKKTRLIPLWEAVEEANDPEFENYIKHMTGRENYGFLGVLGQMLNFLESLPHY